MLFFGSSSTLLCLSMIFFRKPVPTFPDHALGRVIASKFLAHIEPKCDLPETTRWFLLVQFKCKPRVNYAGTRS
jgi:hypothetical protein